MTIPADAIVPIRKVRDYLLKSLPEGDKSGYLKIAGYERSDYLQLMNDIRTQLLPAMGVFQGRDEYGDYYESDGFLHGPNGRKIGVRTIWVLEDDGTWRFITLFPD
jgi:hypothetical protein